MALRYSYASLQEIPEGFREHYGEKNGAFVLQTDPPLDDAQELKDTLTTVRRQLRDAEKSTMDLKVKFEGIDPDEVAKLRDRVKGLDDQELYDRNGIEVLVAKRTQTMRDEHERVTKAKDLQIDQLKETASSLDRKWRQDRIKTALLDAATKVGVYKDAMPDAVQRGLDVFTDLNEQGIVIAKTGEDIRYGKDGVNPLTPEEWYLSIKPTALHLWPPSSGGGAPGHHNGAAGGIDYSAIKSPTERITALRQNTQRGIRG